MRDRWIVVGALTFGLAVLAAPVWLGLSRRTVGRTPTLERPAGETRCVAPAALMRASHMQLLVEWRDRVVRLGVRTWTGPDGRVFRIGLTGTCLRCHGERARFCDRCHAFSGVSPACWSCHVDPATAGGGGT